MRQYSWNGMRASDLERQRTIDELRRHCAAGRLDVDEYALRIEKAMAATTLEELDHLRSDLPMMRIADPAGGRVWAGKRLLPAAPRRDGGLGRPAGPSRFGDRLTALALALVAVAVVVAVLVLALAAEWAWAAVLLAGWLMGVLQARLGSRLRQRS